jgi:hypothetical protein
MQLNYISFGPSGVSLVCLPINAMHPGWRLLQGSDGALPVRAGRAKRENGGLGEDPPGSTMTYLLSGPSDQDAQWGKPGPLHNGV